MTLHLGVRIGPLLTIPQENYEHHTEYWQRRPELVIEKMISYTKLQVFDHHSATDVSFRLKSKHVN